MIISFYILHVILNAIIIWFPCHNTLTVNYYGIVHHVCPEFWLQSYANAVISSFVDPKKILEQTVLEMNDDLTKIRQATAQVSFFCFLCNSCSLSLQLFFL